MYYFILIYCPCYFSFINNMFSIFMQSVLMLYKNIKLLLRHILSFNTSNINLQEFIIIITLINVIFLYSSNCNIAHFCHPSISIYFIHLLLVLLMLNLRLQSSCFLLCFLLQESLLSPFILFQVNFLFIEIPVNITTVSSFIRLLSKTFLLMTLNKGLAINVVICITKHSS